MKIRSANNNDIPAIVELLKLSLGESLMPKSVAYWQWKHIDNPFGKSPVLVAEKNGELIGVRAFMRWGLILGEDSPFRGLGGKLGDKGLGSIADTDMHYGASPKIFEYARSLRKDTTKTEAILWSKLQGKQLGVKFRRQHPIGNYIADFYAHEVQLAIEIDGDYHLETKQKLKDKNREDDFEDWGIKTVRFSDENIIKEIDVVINEIKTQVSEREDSPFRGLGGRGAKLSNHPTTNQITTQRLTNSTIHQTTTNQQTNKPTQHLNDSTPPRLTTPQKAKAVRAVDTATHPDHQGKGIFKKLTLALLEECEREGVDFVYNTPNGNSKSGYLKMAWQELGKLPVQVSIKRPVQVSIKRPLQFLKAKVFKSEVNIFLELETNDFAIEKALENWKLIKHSKKNIWETEYSEKYLRWRYVDIPVIKYYGYADSKAMVIFRLKQSSFGIELRICEAFGNKKSCTSHIKYIYKSCTFDYMSVSGFCEVSLPGMLKKNIKNGPEVTLRSICLKQLTGFEEFEKWHPELGDLEVF